MQATHGFVSYRRKRDRSGEGQTVPLMRRLRALWGLHAVILSLRLKNEACPRSISPSLFPPPIPQGYSPHFPSAFQRDLLSTYRSSYTDSSSAACSQQGGSLVVHLSGTEKKVQTDILWPKASTLSNQWRHLAPSATAVPAQFNLASSRLNILLLPSHSCRPWRH